jgi:hypothetical protein
MVPGSKPAGSTLEEVFSEQSGVVCSWCRPYEGVYHVEDEKGLKRAGQSFFCAGVYLLVRVREAVDELHRKIHLLWVFY